MLKKLLGLPLLASQILSQPRSLHENKALVDELFSVTAGLKVPDPLPYGKFFEDPTGQFSNIWNEQMFVSKIM